MYKGGLVTFTFDDPNHPIALPLSDIEIEVSEKGVFVTRKDTNKKLGYLKGLCGITIDEFMNIFGYTFDSMN